MFFISIKIASKREILKDSRNRNITHGDLVFQTFAGELGRLEKRVTEEKISNSRRRSMFQIEGFILLKLSGILASSTSIFPPRLNYLITTYVHVTQIAYYGQGTYYCNFFENNCHRNVY